MIDFATVFAEMGIEIKKTDPKEIRAIADRRGLKVTDDELVNYAGDIRRMDESMLACESCTGLEGCTNEPAGYEFVSQPFFVEGLTFALRPCARRKQYEELVASERLLASCRVPPYLRGKTFKNFDAADNEAAIRVAASIVRGQSEKGAIFYGPTGVGKTHLAAAILNNRIQAGKTGVYVTVPELMDDLRQAMQNDTIQKARSLVIDTDFIFLDDLGAEKPSEFVVEELFKIVNGRLLKGGITIATTNLDPDALCQRYAGVGGQRIVSRLYEACDWVPLSGRDRRIPS